MQVNFTSVFGSSIDETIQTSAAWICPRIGETVNLCAKNWVVDDLFHEIEEETLTIYLEPK